MATTEIKYNPSAFTSVESMVTHIRGREAETQTTNEQQVWQQVDDDRWMHITLVRHDGFAPYVAVKNALEYSGRIAGGWAQVKSVPTSRLNLVADASAQPTSEPRYIAPKNAASAYAAKRLPAFLRKDETKQ